MNSVFDDPEYTAIVSYFDQYEPAINGFLGFTDESPDFDHARLKFSMKENLIGNIRYRTLHGGVISSILDITGGHTVFLKQFSEIKGLPIEKQVKRITQIGTIDLRVDYLMPGRGEFFVSTGYLLRRGKKVAVVRMELHNDQQELIAAGTGSYTSG